MKERFWIIRVEILKEIIRDLEAILEAIITNEKRKGMVF